LAFAPLVETVKTDIFKGVFLGLLKMKKVNLKLASLLTLALAATASQAAIDVAPVTAEISATLAPIGLIGAGVLLVIVAIKAFKWVRGAM
jgi:Inovirus Coat protein B